LAWQLSPLTIPAALSEISFATPVLNPTLLPVSMVVYRTTLSLSTTCLLPRNLDEGQEPTRDQGMPAKDNRDRSCQGCLGKLANKGVIYLLRLP
jgi:hypothetical protein